MMYGIVWYSQRYNEHDSFEGNSPYNRYSKNLNKIILAAADSLKEFIDFEIGYMDETDDVGTTKYQNLKEFSIIDAVKELKENWFLRFEMDDDWMIAIEIFELSEEI